MYSCGRSRVYVCMKWCSGHSKGLTNSLGKVRWPVWVFVACFHIMFRITIIRFLRAMSCVLSMSLGHCHSSWSYLYRFSVVFMYVTDVYDGG